MLSSSETRVFFLKATLDYSENEKILSGLRLVFRVSIRFYRVVYTELH